MGAGAPSVGTTNLTSGLAPINIDSANLTDEQILEVSRAASIAAVDMAAAEEERVRRAAAIAEVTDPGPAPPIYSGRTTIGHTPIGAQPDEIARMAEENARLIAYRQQVAALTSWKLAEHCEKNCEGSGMQFLIARDRDPKGTCVLLDGMTSADVTVEFIPSIWDWDADPEAVRRATNDADKTRLNEQFHFVTEDPKFVNEGVYYGDWRQTGVDKTGKRVQTMRARVGGHGRARCRYTKTGLAHNLKAFIGATKLSDVTWHTETTEAKRRAVVTTKKGVMPNNYDFVQPVLEVGCVMDTSGCPASTAVSKVSHHAVCPRFMHPDFADACREKWLNLKSATAQADIINKWCRAHLDSTICECINFDQKPEFRQFHEDNKDLLTNPGCYLLACKVTPDLMMKSVNISDQNCPSVCANSIVIRDNSNIDTSMFKFADQSACGAKASGISSLGDTGLLSAADATKESGGLTANEIGWIVAGVVLLLMLGFGIYWTRFRGAALS